MSGSAAKLARRDLRRAVGMSAINIVDQQSSALRQLIGFSNRSVARIDALEDARDDAIGKFRAFRQMSLFARLKWVLLGE